MNNISNDEYLCYNCLYNYYRRGDIKVAGFIYKLQNIVNSSPYSDDTNVNFSRCILKNITTLKKKNSLQDFADICYTSQSSISRYAQHLGYTNFNDFKLDVLGVEEEKNEMIIDTHAMKSINYNDFSKSISESLLNIQEESLKKDIEQLCQYIHDANRIFIFATHIPGDLACIIQRAILITGKYVEFYPRKEHQMEIVKQAHPDDLCIFFSLEGTLLMEKGITIPAIISLAKTVLVTQNVHVKFSEQFTQIIGLGIHDSEIVGKYKLLFFIDCLSNHYYNKYIVNN